MTSLPRKVLIVRSDRIGDVVLTLPMASVLKRRYPQVECWLMLQSYTAELAGFAHDVSGVLLYDEGGKAKPFFELVREVRAKAFDAVVVVYPRPRLAWLMRLAGIPVRVGSGYRWYSFLFNRRVYEHRRTAEKHEVQYNASLLRGLDCDVPERVAPRIQISETLRAEALALRNELGVGRRSRLIILHPGSGGSARDWSAENFAALASSLITNGFTVTVTGSAAESALVQKIVSASGGLAKNMAGRCSLTQLAALISTANVFVSNSTGPLHIAAAVGTPVVAFYPPATVMSERRWGPLTEKKIVFVPNPALCRRCNGGACSSDECMNQISAAQAVEAVQSLSKKYKR